MKDKNIHIRESTKITDRELVILLANNDEDAFRTLYYRYKDKLWRFCFGFLKSEFDTDDILQEIFISLWEHRVTVDPSLAFSSYLYKIARNKILNFFRDMDVEVQVKKALAQQTQTVAGTDSVEADIFYGEYRRILAEAVGQLPPQRRKVFNMSRFEYKSHKEIAVQLGISINTVQDHISQALRTIKAYVSQHTDITFGIIILLYIALCG